MENPTGASLTTSGAAKRLGVHPDTVVAWADAGKLACWRTPGGQRRFSPADIEALMEPQTGDAA
jgi:excisionase family DNA binding protein